MNFVANIANFIEEETSSGRGKVFQALPVEGFTDQVQATVNRLEEQGHTIVALIPLTEGFGLMENRADVIPTSGIGSRIATGGCGTGISFTTGIMIHSTTDESSMGLSGQ